jgi:hypothetical protein
MIEFHDQPWFPSSLRDGVTDTLEFVLGLRNLYAPMVPRLRRALQEAGTRRILDLCSGGGGPWLWMSRLFQKEENFPVDVCLTDKYPNRRAFAHERIASSNKINFSVEAVDATQVPGDLHGFRTIFTSFHHFRPKEARAILQNAVDNQEGIAVFEAPGRHPLTLLLLLSVPIVTLAVVPFIRPFRWSRLLWTYLVPLLPFVLFFDGVVSCLRVYSPKELLELTSGLSASGYRWEVGEERKRGLSVPITYLIGHPSLGAGPRFESGLSS